MYKSKKLKIITIIYLIFWCIFSPAFEIQDLNVKKKQDTIALNEALAHGIAHQRLGYDTEIQAHTVQSSMAEFLESIENTGYLSREVNRNTTEDSEISQSDIERFMSYTLGDIQFDWETMQIKNLSLEQSNAINKLMSEGNSFKNLELISNTSEFGYSVDLGEYKDVEYRDFTLTKVGDEWELKGWVENITLPELIEAMANNIQVSLNRQDTTATGNEGWSYRTGSKTTGNTINEALNIQLNNDILNASKVNEYGIPLATFLSAPIGSAARLGYSVYVDTTDHDPILKLENKISTTITDNKLGQQVINTALDIGIWTGIYGIGHQIENGIKNIVNNVVVKNGTIKVEKTINNILKDTVPGRNTRGRTTQYLKEGTYDDAIADFNRFKVIDRQPINGNYNLGERGVLKNGWNINVRPGSTEGSPTLDIMKINKHHIKIRYKK